VALTGVSSGSVIGPDMLSWQAYQAGSAESPEPAWEKTIPAEQGKVQTAVAWGFAAQDGGPRWKQVEHA